MLVVKKSALTGEHAVGRHVIRSRVLLRREDGELNTLKVFGTTRTAGRGSAGGRQRREERGRGVWPHTLFFIGASGFPIYNYDKAFSAKTRRQTRENKEQCVGIAA